MVSKKMIYLLCTFFTSNTSNSMDSEILEKFSGAKELALEGDTVSGVIYFKLLNKYNFHTTDDEVDEIFSSSVLPALRKRNLLNPPDKFNLLKLYTYAGKFLGREKGFNIYLTRMERGAAGLYDETVGTPLHAQLLYFSWKHGMSIKKFESQPEYKDRFSYFEKAAKAHHPKALKIVENLHTLFA